MPKSKREYEWAGTIRSHEYEPLYGAANQVVRLYHTALDQHYFSLLFTCVDASVSVDDLIARAAPERYFSRISGI